MDTENKNEQKNGAKKHFKETIYDKIDIPLKKLDKFLIGAIVFLIILTIFSIL
ncbi:hypothetical protein [uncultured Tyzzerella sp.]|uniref:hypothetical protein n=1 Tax=uncultured Tyzzerella sp. TaxID=2321398 RepID=UPI002942A6B8|nr:hypothetical protein [uncultured Tyzzerella sp.]